MAIKQSEGRHSLKQKLHERKLYFEDKELDDALIKYNYFNLFNGIENLLLSSRNPKRFNKVTLDDFIIIYKFNKKLATTILEILDNIESKLKNSVAHHFTQTYCLTISDTMNYTLKSNYIDPKNSQFANNYPFVNYQNKRIYDEFDNFILFKPFYLTKLINENDHIDYRFYTDSRYTSQRGQTTFRTGQAPNYTYHTHVAVPFWVAIETLTLGEVICLLHYLDPYVLNKVMEDFNMPLFYRNEFLNMFDIIKSLRNFCAHGSLVYRYQSPKYIKLNANLVSLFNLTPSETGTPPSALSLFDTLQIVNYFESTKPLKKHINSIIYRNNKHFKSPDFDLNTRLLTRMGNPNLKDWKKFIFMDSQYHF
jgi:hypothetical protein